MPVLSGGVEFVPREKIRAAVGLAQPPLLENVIAHVLKLTNEILVDKKHVEQLEGVGKVSQMLWALYEHLQMRSKAETGTGGQKQLGKEGGVWGRLRGPAWLLVDEGEMQFAATNQVFQNLDDEFRPLLFPLPQSLLPFYTLLNQLGVWQKPSAETYADGLCVKYAECRDAGREPTLSPDELEMVLRLLRNFGEAVKSEGGENESIPTPLLEKIYVPDEKLKLATCQDVVHCDDPAIRKCIDDSQFRFLHSGVSGPLAARLGVPFLSGLVHGELDRGETLQQEIDDEDAKRFSETLTSAEFREGLLRIVRFQAEQSAKSTVSVRQQERIERLRSFIVVRVKSVLSRFTLRATGADVMKDGRRGSCVTDGEACRVFLAETLPDGTEAEGLLAQAIGLFVGVANHLHVSAMFQNPPDKIATVLTSYGVPLTEALKPSNPAAVALGGELLDAHRAMLKSDPEGRFSPGEWVAWMDATCQDQQPDEKVYRYGKVVGACDPESSSKFAAKYDVEVGEGDVRQLFSASMFKFDARFAREKAARAADGHVAKDAEMVLAGGSPKGKEKLEEGGADEEMFKDGEPSDAQADATRKKDKYRPLSEKLREAAEMLKEIWEKLPPGEHRRAIRRLYLHWHPDKNMDDQEDCTEVMKWIQKMAERGKAGFKYPGEEAEEAASSQPKRPRYDHPDFDFAAWAEQFRRESEFRRKQEAWNGGFPGGFSGFCPQPSGAHSHWQYAPEAEPEPAPKPDPQQAAVWMRACQVDVAVLRRLHAAGDYSWACFMAHQVAEKAIKSALYARGTFSHWDLKTHDLEPQLKRLGPAACTDLREAVRLVNGMSIPTRYPNSCPYGQIPSDIFSANEAHKALAAATLILERCRKF